MNDPIERRVAKWDENVQSGQVNKFSLINRKIIYLNDRLYFDYEPHLGSKISFFTRLNSWLENVDGEEYQKILFELIPKLFYVGRDELNLLYREAYISNYAKWLIDTTNQNFESLCGGETINNLVGNTWFCPLTDSFRINQFYHINDIPGKHDHRPDWRSLVEFGDVEKIRKYIQKHEIKRIVLLEDFVGNGGQVSKAVQLATDNFKEIPILIIPLIICPAGFINSKNLQSKYDNVTIDPVIVIGNDSLVQIKIDDNSPDFFRDLHTLLVSTYPQVSNSDIVADDVEPYGPFGWRNTGSLVVMHTNTPNNTLPLIHNAAQTWTPLFKRHKRI